MPIDLARSGTTWQADPGWLNTATYGLPPDSVREAVQEALSVSYLVGLVAAALPDGKGGHGAAGTTGRVGHARHHGGGVQRRPVVDR